MTGDKEQRRYYRLRYPIPARLRLEVDGRLCEIIELSEEGLRLSFVAVPKPEPDPDREQDTDLSPVDEQVPPKAIHVSITLACGSQRTVDATFLRSHGDEHVYHELRGISMRDVTEEQRYLITNFPSFRRD